MPILLNIPGPHSHYKNPRVTITIDCFITYTLFIHVEHTGYHNVRYFIQHVTSTLLNFVLLFQDAKLFPYSTGILQNDRGIDQITFVFSYLLGFYE